MTLRRSKLSRTLVCLTLCLIHPTSAFLSNQNSNRPPHAFSTYTYTGTGTASPIYLSMSSRSSINSKSNTSIQDKLRSIVTPTDRGRSASAEEQRTIEQSLKDLESTSTIQEPTRSPFTAGTWEVLYTTAPAPSNGKLGPFNGIAKQVIDIPNRRYSNVLLVPPNDWLKAVLDASWEEWDGVMIEDDAESIKKWTGTQYNEDNDDSESNIRANDLTEAPKPSFLDSMVAIFTGNANKSTLMSSTDYGGTCWRVTFETLTISLFGIPLFTQKFGKSTQRIWRTTFLDENTRIVRAGRTGNKSDEMVFYMTRDK